MIKLDISKEKHLQFEINIQGIDYKKLKGSIRLEIDNVEYGFPIKINKDEITTIIPPLNNIIKNGLVNEETIQSKLEIYGEGFYLNPWSEDFLIEAPVLVEAKVIKESNKKENKNTKSIDVNLISENDKSSKKCKVNNSDEINDDFNIDSIDGFTGDKIMNNDIEMNHQRDVQSKQINDPELIHTIAKARADARKKSVTNVVDKLLKQRGVTQVGEKKKVCKKKKVKNITESTILRLMENHGLKTPKIQQLILDKAMEKTLGDLNKSYFTIKKMLVKNLN